MHAFRLHRTCFAWLAMGALLFGALASGIAPMVRSAGAQAWVEVCTVVGAKWVSAEASTAGIASHAPGEGGTGAHCPWCSLHTPAMLLAARPQVLLALVRAGTTVVPAVSAPPRQPRAWALAPSRAPPLAS